MHSLQVVISDRLSKPRLSNVQFRSAAHHRQSHGGRTSARPGTGKLLSALIRQLNRSVSTSCADFFGSGAITTLACPLVDPPARSSVLSGLQASVRANIVISSHDSLSLMLCNAAMSAAVMVRILITYSAVRTVVKSSRAGVRLTLPPLGP